MKPGIILASLSLLFGASTIRAQVESRYKNEIVFPQGMRNFSVGVSPTVSNRFMLHSENSYSETVIVPPVSIFWETAIADFGKAGSIGAGTQIDYYRYKYHFLWDDGYGDKDIEVNSGQVLFTGVLSYHYTLATRLEIYAKAMAMISVVGRTYSEERLDPKGLDASFTFGAAVGLRYFFSRTWGVYAEGGRIPGSVAVGLTARW